MEQESLKPCPFCGGEAVLKSSVGDPFGEDRVSWRAVCERQMCQGGACNVWEATPEEAAAKWNARAERTCRIVWRSDLSYVPEEGGYMDDGQYVCTACGEPLPDCVDHWWDSYQGDGYEGEPPFRCCPNCGARIEVMRG